MPDTQRKFQSKAAIMTTALLAVLFVGFSITIPSRNARGTPSCPAIHVDQELAAADAAFIGKVIEQRNPPGFPAFDNPESRTVWVLDVEKEVKGQLGDKVEVHAHPSSPIGMKGRKIGLFLQRNGHRWESSGCQTVSPAALIRASGPLPRRTGRGAPVFVLGGNFGSARLVALNRSGRVLAYGKGEGYTTELSWCPGSKRLLESVDNGNNDLEKRIAFRDATDLRLLREVPVPASSHSPPMALDVDELSCRNRSGDALVSLTNHARGNPATGMILRVKGAKTTTIYSGGLNEAAFSRRQDTAYATSGDFGLEVIRIDLKSGSTETIAKMPADTEHISLSPDEKSLAVLVSGVRVRGGAPARLAVIDLTTRPPQTTQFELKEATIGDRVLWVDSRTLVYVPITAPTPRSIEAGSTMRTGQFRLVRGFEGLQVRSPSVAGFTLYGLGPRGVQSSEVGSDRVKHLPDPVAFFDAMVLTTSR